RFLVGAGGSPAPVGQYSQSRAGEPPALRRGLRPLHAEAEDTGELGGGVLVIVDAEVEEAVADAVGAGLVADDEDGGGLLAALVAAGLLSGFEGGHQAPGERALAVLEGLGHVVDDRFAGEDVALAGVVFPRLVARVFVAAAAGEGGGLPLGV